MANTDLYDFNLIMSLAKHVRASAFVATHAYPVNFGDTQFNPSAYPRWVSFEWVYFGGRVTSQNSVHARCFSRTEGDRFGKLRETMVGRLKEALAVVAGIALYDFITTPSTPALLTWNDDTINMAIRFGDRSALMDGRDMAESGSTAKGIDMVVLSYNIYVARPHEVH